MLQRWLVSITSKLYLVVQKSEATIEFSIADSLNL